jgi:predicted phage-related endonuclease
MLLEIKNVDSLVFRNEWTEDEDGNIEPPLHILFQVHTQMLVSGITTAYVAALVGGNRASLYRCEYDEQIGARIIEEADKLWNGPEPTPDFHRDADVIAKLYGYSEPDSVMQATPDMERLMAEADEHRRLSAVHNDEYEARQAELRMLSGRAERVEAEGYTLSLGMRAPVEVKAHTRAGYRGFNLTKRKRK